MTTTPSAARSALTHALGLVAGFGLLAIANAVTIAVAAPWPSGGLRVSVLHHVFDALELYALAAVGGAIVGAARYATARWRIPLFAPILAYGAVGTVVINQALGSDLLRQAIVLFEGRFERPLFALFVLLTGFAIPAAHLLGFLLLRWRWTRPIPLILAVGGIITNESILRDDYAGLHGAIGWTAATLAAGTLAPWMYKITTHLRKRLGTRVLVGSAAALALVGLVVRPPNDVRLVMFRQPGALAQWVLAATLWPTPSIDAPAPPPSEWFEPRDARPAVAPSPKKLIAKAPVVVLITIDALRGDVASDPAYDAMFPHLAALKRSSAVFTRATSAGGQTTVSLSTLFSGRYFSSLAWRLHGVGDQRFLYPADDPSPRFPELLDARGVVTVAYPSVNFLAGDFGVARGFREQTVIARGRSHAHAASVVSPLLARLKKADHRPMFLFAHLMEPHAPYDRGKLKKGPAFDRYLSEIVVADAALGRIIERLREPRLRDRAVLIISADHGEAFGEHSTFEHTKTVYDELLHVPLIIHGPGIAPRRVDEHVGLIDVGPTILDIFGLPTPGTFMGQSLVPVLEGQPPSFTRPLAAEGRLRRTLFVPPSLKVIEDLRRKTIEVYDVANDPGELHNLYDDDRPRAEPAVAALRAFFAAHARPGPVAYKP